MNKIEVSKDATYNALIGLYVYDSLDKALENSTEDDVQYLLDENVQHHFNFNNNDLIRVLSSTKCVRANSVYHVVNTVLHEKAEFEETIYCMKKLYHSVESRFNILYNNVQLSSNIDDDLMFVVRNYSLSRISNALSTCKYNVNNTIAAALITEYTKNGRLTQTIRLTNPDLDEILKDYL